MSVLRTIEEIKQSILTQNKTYTYLFMHLYIQPIGHLVILRKKKMTLLNSAIVKTIPKFTLTQTSSIQRHTDLQTFTSLEDFPEFKIALHFAATFCFVFFGCVFLVFCFIYIASCKIYKEQ